MASCELTFTDCPCCDTLCLGPTILPCGHFTCRQCLRRLVEDGGSWPVCPFCGHSIPRGQGQTTTQLLDQLGRDIILEDLVSETLTREIDVCCQNCPRNRLAAKVCLDCNVTLCQDCCDSHQSHATQGLYEKCASNVTPDQAVSATRAEDTMENHRRERTMLEDKEDELCEAECLVQSTMADLQRVLQVVRERKAVLQTYSTRLPTVVNISKLEVRLKCLRLESCPPSLSAMLANLRRDTDQCIALWTTAGHTPVKTLDTLPLPTPIPPEYRVNVQQAGQVHVAQNMVEIHVTRGDSTPDEAAGGEGQPIPHVERLLVAHHATIINLNLGHVGVDQITDDRITRAVEDVLMIKIDWAKERARAQELKAEKQRLARQVESERVKGKKAVDEAEQTANARLEQLYHEHQQEKGRERAKMKTFVMKIEEKNKRLLEQLMEHLGQGAVLGEIIQRLFEEFDVRLLGVTCGLSFLMDTPEEEWERVQQRQADVQRTLAQNLLSGTFTPVMPYDADTDIDLRLGLPLPAPRMEKSPSLPSFQRQPPPPSSQGSAPFRFEDQLAGYLNKTKIADTGRRVRKNWSQAFVVIQASNLVFYKDDKAAKKKAGSPHGKPDSVISLQGARVDFNPPNYVTGTSRKNIILLTLSSGTQFLLHTDDEKKIHEWLVRLKLVANDLRQDQAATSKGQEGSGTGKSVAASVGVGRSLSSTSDDMSASYSSTWTKFRNLFLGRPAQKDLEENL